MLERILPTGGRAALSRGMPGAVIMRVASIILLKESES
jgi:hypothetical protein